MTSPVLAALAEARRQRAPLFAHWCEREQETFCPASPATVARFAREHAGLGVDRLWQALHEAGAEPAATLQTTYSSTICRLAAEGAGIGIVNPYAARVFGQALTVVPLVPAIAVEVRLAHAGHLASSRLTEVFASLVAEGLEA